jgi:hypothetical protein
MARMVRTNHENKVALSMQTLLVQRPSQSKIMVQREDNQERVTVKYIQCGSCAKRRGKAIAQWKF